MSAAERLLSCRGGMMTPPEATLLLLPEHWTAAAVKMGIAPELNIILHKNPWFTLRLQQTFWHCTPTLSLISYDQFISTYLAVLKEVVSFIPFLRGFSPFIKYILLYTLQQKGIKLNVPAQENRQWRMGLKDKQEMRQDLKQMKIARNLHYCRVCEIKCVRYGVWRTNTIT